MKQEKHLSRLHYELLSDISLAFFLLLFLGFWGFVLLCLFCSNISVFNTVIVLIRLLKYTASPNSSPTKIYPLACLGTHNLQMELLDTHMGTSSSNKLQHNFLKGSGLCSAASLAGMAEAALTTIPSISQQWLSRTDI